MTETRITNQHGMSPAPAGRVTNQQQHSPRHGWLALLLVVPLSAAACGSGSSSPNVANLGSTPSTTTSSATSGTSLDRFSACMRSHGVPAFPDPINNGRSLHVQVGPGGPVDPSSPQYQARWLPATAWRPASEARGPADHTRRPARLPQSSRLRTRPRLRRLPRPHDHRRPRQVRDATGSEHQLSTGPGSDRDLPQADSRRPPVQQLNVMKGAPRWRAPCVTEERPRRRPASFVACRSGSGPVHVEYCWLDEGDERVGAPRRVPWLVSGRPTAR